MTIDALDWTKFTDGNEIPEWISHAYSDSYQGPHEDEPGTPSATDSGGDPGTADGALPAGLAPTGGGEPGRRVPARRPGWLRSRAPGGHRRRRHADGFGDRPAASTGGVLRRDHEPGLPRAPGQHRRPARRRSEGVRRRRDRRDLAPRPALTVGGPQRAARSRTPAAGCARRRAQGRGGRDGDDRRARRPGQRCRVQRERPLPG